MPPILTVAIRYEHDVVAARQRAREIAGLLGFDDVGGRALARTRPQAIVLDILLSGGEDSWSFLAELKASPLTRDIPVVVATVVEKREKGMVLGADDYCVKPVDRDWLVSRLESLTGGKEAEKVLIIDDEETARYLVAAALAGTRFRPLQAASGEEGLRTAREEGGIAAVFLDLMMPGMDGFEVLDRLKGDERTRDIPVIIVTGKVLDAGERERLRKGADDWISKGHSREDVLGRLRRALGAKSG